MSNAQEKETVFVVGAMGNVGSRVAAHLTDVGRAVRAATRWPEAYDGPAEPVRFDFTDPGTHAPAVEGAGSAFVMTPADVEAYPQLIPFMQTAADAGVRRIVLMTAMGVDQAPDDVPLRAAELHLEQGDQEHTLLRPNWFMQNFLTYWRGMIEADGVMRLPAAEAETRFIDTDDIAAVAAAALTRDGHDGQGYTLTGPEAFTYHEAAEVLSDASGRDIRYEPVSDEEARNILTEAGLDAEYAGMLVGLFQNVKAGHAAPVTPAVEQVTGRPPRSLEAFARDNADAWS
jgi:uncharacterized protein YbjT (DUF2867 family)